MKVAIVTNKVDSVGGVQVFTRDISGILQDRGHSVDVIGGNSLRGESTKGLEEAVGNEFNKRNAENPYDVVLCNGEFGYSVEHPKAINVFHGNYYGYARALKPLVSREVTEERMRKAEMQRVSARGKYIVTVSDSSRRQLEEFGILVDGVIPNSVDPKLFFPDSNMNVGTHALALSRGMYYEKGFDVLKRLAERGIKLRLFSDRDIDSPNVDNRDTVENEALRQEYNKARVLLFPSRFEGGSLTVLEAMACGCPIVTTPTGYGAEIQEEIPNFVADSFAAFFAKVNLVSSDRERYSEKAKHYFWRFHNPREFRRNWIELIEGI